MTERANDPVNVVWVGPGRGSGGAADYADRIEMAAALRATPRRQPPARLWTKTADQILDSIARYFMRINDSRH